MSKGFDECAKNGGKLRTKSLKNNKFIRICYDKDGKSHAGPVMTNRKTKLHEGGTKNRKVEDSERLIVSLNRLQEHINNKYHSGS